jgi:hypothetical protein
MEAGLEPQEVVEDTENKRHVVSRAKVCRLLVEEGRNAQLDKKGNVVVTSSMPGLVVPCTLSEHRVKEKQLSVWRQAIHTRAAELGRGEWVSVKGPGLLVELSQCRFCRQEIMK